MQGRNGYTDIENGLVDTVGEGEGRKNWESSMCKTDSLWEPAVKQPGGSVWLFKEVGQDGGGRLKREQIHINIQFWLIPVVIWQKPEQHCNAIILQLKNQKEKEKSPWEIIKSCFGFCFHSVHENKKQQKTQEVLKQHCFSWVTWH